MNPVLRNGGLVVELQRVHRSLSSAVLGGGLGWMRTWLSLQVPSDHDGDDPGADLLRAGAGGVFATGTATDALCVACPPGSSVPYVGPATETPSPARSVSSRTASTTFPDTAPSNRRLCEWSWTWREKLVGTLLVPGGLSAAFAVGVLGIGFALPAGAGPLLLVFLLVVTVATVGFLAWRLRRAEPVVG
ncbi:MAG TPA: hypothetical protein VNO34_09260 [Actinomycetota bacterium]|nr:hypothetical protein [Actinomycetota bacterium]